MQKFEKPYLIELPKKLSEEGSIIFAELGSLIPLQVKRMFWIKDVPHQAKRGIHAHLKENQILFCLSGSVSINLELLDKSNLEYQLSNAYQGLFLPALAWSEITFDEHAVLLVISDQLFEEDNYIRDKVKFQKLQEEYKSNY